MSNETDSNGSSMDPPSEAFIEGLKQLDAGQLAKAIEIFAETASAGDPDGNFYLGLAYDGLLGRDAADEPPIEPDVNAAVRCYRRAAEAGHAQAMLNLSMSYRSGEGVEAPDIEAAFEWLERSAAAGDERAAFNCGVALDPLHPPYGTPGAVVIPKNAARAVEYYRSASDQGHGKAMVNLGCASIHQLPTTHASTATWCHPDPAYSPVFGRLTLEQGCFVYGVGLCEGCGLCKRAVDSSGGTWHPASYILPQ